MVFLKHRIFTAWVSRSTLLPSLYISWTEGRMSICAFFVEKLHQTLFTLCIIGKFHGLSPKSVIKCSLHALLPSAKRVLKWIFNLHFYKTQTEFQVKQFFDLFWILYLFFVWEEQQPSLEAFINASDNFVVETASFGCEQTGERKTKHNWSVNAESLILQSVLKMTFLCSGSSAWINTTLRASKKQ